MEWSIRSNVGAERLDQKRVPSIEQPIMQPLRLFTEVSSQKVHKPLAVYCHHLEAVMHGTELLHLLEP